MRWKYWAKRRRGGFYWLRDRRLELPRPPLPRHVIAVAVQQGVEEMPDELTPEEDRALAEDRVRRAAEAQG